MYDDAEVELQRILKLVELCPDPYRLKAFEVFLQGYVAAQTPARPGGVLGITPPPPPPADQAWRTGIPAEALTRLQTMAARIKADAARLAGLFDFSSDPFTLAAVHVPGKNGSERARAVAVVVAVRAYLATGKWSADWSEVKATCIDQNCYDNTNFSKQMAAGVGGIFTSAKPGESVQLSAAGQKEADRILAVLAGAPDAT